MSERMPVSAEGIPTTESPKGGGIRGWLREKFSSLLSRPQAPETMPAWSMQMHGHVDRSRPISLTITRIPGERSFSVQCSSGFVGKTLVFQSIAEAEYVERTLPLLGADEQAKLAGCMGFTNLDDQRLDHPEGAAHYMKNAILQACSTIQN
jgi:hypothetical protein